MKNTRTIAKSRIAAIVSLCLLVPWVPAYGGPSKGCTITIRNDIHIAPAAELATTKGYPDIIILENSLIKVSAVPNRGRLIFDYVSKATGHSAFYTNTSPMPIKTDQGYFLEFGGYYASYPWNPRSNQPYDLEYEVLRETPEECSIRIYKHGLETGVDFDCLLTVKAKDPSVYVTLTLTNVGGQEKAMAFFDKAVISLGEEMRDRMEIVLPPGVDQVTIGQSADGWMGSEGEQIAWPQPWQKWGAFEGEGHFGVDLKGAKGRSIQVLDLESGESMVKEWDDDAPYGTGEWRSSHGGLPTRTLLAPIPESCSPRLPTGSSCLPANPGRSLSGFADPKDSRWNVVLQRRGTTRCWDLMNPCSRCMTAIGSSQRRWIVAVLTTNGKKSLLAATFKTDGSARWSRMRRIPSSSSGKALS
jgi:hypothetical protein